MTTEDLRRVVARAVVSDGPGVCVVAAGDGEATLLMMLIEIGLVSQAIVDHSRAAKLANLLRRATSDSGLAAHNRPERNAGRAAQARDRSGATKERNEDREA